MKRETKSLLTAVAIPLAVGGVSGFLTRNSMSAFQKLKKPPLSPPGWLFPVCARRRTFLTGASPESAR